MTSPRDVAASAGLLDPAGFGAHLTQGHFKIPRWVDHVSRIIAEEFAKGGARVAISTPPQHGKSQLCAVIVPPWCQERGNGNRKVVVASYASELATRSVRLSRNLVIDNQDRVRVRIGKSAEDYWETIPGGGFTPGYVRAVGVGSGVTGFGITDGILDDLYKGIEDATSAVQQQKVEEWYWGEIVPRLATKANLLSIGTRWASNDHIGKRVRGGDCREIRLPAIAEENDPLGRRPGEALWPELHPIEDLLAIRDGRRGDGRDAMPPKIWSALYQGRPIDESGGIFQLPWLSHEVDVRPSLVSGRVRYWDPAASKRQRAGDPDWAVGTLMSKIRTGALDGAYCVEEIDRFRGSALEVERRIIAAAVRDGKRVPIRIEQEPGSEAVLYIAYLQRLLAGWDVKGVVHGTDKATRARPFASQCEVGNVVFVRGPWLVQAREELCGFVGDGSEDHDDVPDSMTGAFEALAGAVRWPWMSAAAAGRDRRDRAPRDEIGFDRGEFDRALESCASSAATQFGGGDL